MYNTLYYTLTQNFMKKCNTILSKMYKHLVQQIVHQKVQRQAQQKLQQKVHNNYVAHFIKWFVFTKLVECLC